jgi:DNA-binding NtrC family response regulator
VASADAAQRQLFAEKFQSDFTLVETEHYDGLREALANGRVDLILLDIDLPPGGVKPCLGLLKDIESRGADTLAIILSSDNAKSTALKVMDAGAYDYFIHPIDADVLRTIIDRAIEKLRIQRENRILRDALDRKDATGDLLGSTEVMRTLFAAIERVAPSASTVVIRGESGTGKELVARAIHDLSPRRDRAFVSVNCAALPETLMEAELFGYERGAFTGAVTTKEGRIELAHRGSLFLDEIGTLSPALQSKLLRVLEERALTRLGGKKSLKVDFRLISATNEDLETAVKRGKFREDLYYRIHVVPLLVPPLRERVEDIELLVNYFVRVYCAANHVPAKRVEDQAMLALKRYAWPGNVRELENAVQRTVLMTDEETISIRNLPAEIMQAAARSSRNQFRLPSGGIRLLDEVAAYERQWLESALTEAQNVKIRAAQLLGLNKEQMKYLCRKYRL